MSRHLIRPIRALLFVSIVVGLYGVVQPVHRALALTRDDCINLNAGSCDFSCDESAGEQEVGICEPSYPLHPIGGVCCTKQKLQPGHSAKTSGNPTGVAASATACEKGGGKCKTVCDPKSNEFQSGACPDQLLTPLCCVTSKAGDVSNVAIQPIKLTDPLHGIGIIGAINRIILAFLGMVGAIALLAFFYAGVMYMTAGSSDRVKKSVDTMKYAALGVLIILFAYTITNVYFSLLLQAPAK